MIDSRFLIDDLGSKLLRYFYSAFGYEHGADLVQEVFVRLVPKIKEQNLVTQKQIQMYAYGIAKNVKLENYKKVNRNKIYDFEKLIDEIPVDDNSYYHLENKEKIQKLREAIEQLSPKEKEAILLLVDWDLSLNEIGEIMKLPLGTIKSHIHRGKQHLKQILSHDPEFSL